MIKPGFVGNRVPVLTIAFQPFKHKYKYNVSEEIKTEQERRKQKIQQQQTKAEVKRDRRVNPLNPISRQEPLHRIERSSQARIPKNIEYKSVNHRDQAMLSSISRVARYNDAIFYT